MERMRRVHNSRNHPHHPGFLWCTATPLYLKVTRHNRWTKVWAENHGLAKGYFHDARCPRNACKKIAREC